MTAPTLGQRYGSATVELLGDTQILISRVFDATPVEVFRAWTTPEIVRRWWSGPDRPTTVCEIDLRVGGSWRYVIDMGEGAEVGFHGTYREIEPPELLVYTEVFEGFPDGEAVNRFTLVADGDTTVMRVVVEHSCREHRDMHVQSGMEGGMQLCMDRIDQLIAEARP